MNIFKVLASGKRQVYEEQMTTILAWLLHPQMEHGLGHEFLGRFVKAVSTESPRLAVLADGLGNRLRGEPVGGVSIELEEHVPNAFVDMVVSIDGWKIGVENKIYPASASDPRQLNREYCGLVTKFGHDEDGGENKTVCALIFLVPADELGELSSQVKNEWDSFDRTKLRPDRDDFVGLITWQENKIGYPSVVSLIEGLLVDESTGRTEPIGDYTRHTLKALAMFIRGDFSGYDYDKINAQNVPYPYIKSSDILGKTVGIVGIRWGLSGLLRQSADDMKAAKYKYSDSATPHNPNWITLDDFKQLYNWKVFGATPVIKWDRRRLGAEVLYDIVSACPTQPLYIGIQGGIGALRNMDMDTIRNSAWQLVTADAPPTASWISGSDFREILERMGMKPDKNANPCISEIRGVL